MNVDIQTENNKNTESSHIKDQAEGDGAAQAGATATGTDEGAELQDEKIRHLEEEVQDAKDKYLRTLAELDNMRRRHERDRQDLLKFATEKLLQDLLPVLDSFEKATVVVGTDADNAIVEGIRMVHKQLTHVLEVNGLKAVEAAGKAFDPNFHQAIQRIEGEVEQETVKDEFQRGYTLNGRLIRPSMVSVLVPKSGPG
ncbi:nucleotide exchange factor GrpE [Oligoflexus tunisiensis]|uniref:nucleotide exchange factor GrpE n=1 Tax=Oligoflexus tunisiensis TaxID=708132 RepID=UPI00159F0A81|nr:nucleotide exchange factor GrpE [Oligoflexus tunisiensis]